MDYAVTLNRYHQIVSQKNFLLGFLGVSLLLNILQVAERLTVTEKIIVLPPSITKDVWIKGNSVSESYLEEWSLYLTNLLLNVSAKTIGYQAELAMRHVSPDFSGKIQKKLVRDTDALQKNNATTTFSPKEIKVIEKTMTVYVTGTFSTYVGKERVSAHEQTYQLNFVFNKGRFLQLTQFTLNRKEPLDMDADNDALTELPLETKDVTITKEQTS